MGDYWDDVDAVVRNQLVEQQLVRADLLQRVLGCVAGDSTERPASAYPCRSTRRRRHRALARQLRRPLHADQHPQARGSCSAAPATARRACTTPGKASCARADGSAQVNLLLNRAGKSVDVDSYLPYEGKVVVHNKSDRRIAVRMPCWADRGASAPARGRRSSAPSSGWVTTCWSTISSRGTDRRDVPGARDDGQLHGECADGHGADLHAARSGAARCVDIGPRDQSPTSYPLYERDHLRSGVTPMKAATRFASDRVITNW